jgi:hypothetical protein
MDLVYISESLLRRLSNRDPEPGESWGYCASVDEMDVLASYLALDFWLDNAYGEKLDDLRSDVRVVVASVRSGPVQFGPFVRPTAAEVIDFFLEWMVDAADEHFGVSPLRDAINQALGLTDPDSEDERCSPENVRWMELLGGLPVTGYSDNASTPRPLAKPQMTVRAELRMRTR